MVSVVIITFNRCNLLKETLKSVLAQTYEGLEIILIDDGSSDETHELVSSIRDERIKYFNFGKIGNLSKLRNLGIKNSSYDIIGFCDDDDLWHPDKLEEQLKYLDKYGLVCSNAAVIDSDTQIIKQKYYPEFNGSIEIDLNWLLSKGNPILTSSTLIKKNIIIENKLFFDEITFTNYCEDFELFLRLKSKCRFLFLDKNLISKRVHNSVSGGLDNNIIMLKSSIEILERYMESMSPAIKEKALEGIIGYNILLIKLSFKKKILTGIRECIKFITLLINQNALMLFIKIKILKNK